MNVTTGKCIVDRRGRRIWASFAVALFCVSVFGQEMGSSQDLLQPGDFAGQADSKTKSDAVLLFVGFPVLYRSAHIPGALLAGPCSKPEGVDALKKAVHEVSRNRRIVIYCGCCPFVKCPNVRPAYAALRQLGFSDVKVIAMDTNFHTDWVAKGFPVARTASSVR